MSSNFFTPKLTLWLFAEALFPILLVFYFWFPGMLVSDDLARTQDLFNKVFGTGDLVAISFTLLVGTLCCIDIDALKKAPPTDPDFSTKLIIYNVIICISLVLMVMLYSQIKTESIRDNKPFIETSQNNADKTNELKSGNKKEIKSVEFNENEIKSYQYKKSMGSILCLIITILLVARYRRSLDTQGIMR